LPEIDEEPLRRFQVARTRDTEVMREALLTRYGATSCDIPDDPDFFGRANFIEHAAVSVGFCSYGSEAAVQFPESDYVRLQIGLRGFASTISAGIATDIHPECSCISAPNQEATLRFGRGYEQLILRIQRPALEQQLSRILGFLPKGTLQFAPALRLGQPHAHSLRHLVTFFAGQMQDSAATLPPLLIAELEQAITIAFLYASQHNCSELLRADAKDGAPTHVRRAEAYIEANWQQPITIEKLSAETNVSSRTLLRAFLRHRGYTPHTFLKRTRLNGARKMLETAAPGTSVTSVAFICGFGNPGHFAKDYRLAFGELPSDTLSRAKHR
jgi:AraC-like DNA-binding protein